MASTEQSTEVGGRSAGEVLAWSRALVDPALRAAVDTLPDAMRRIAGHHFGWWDEEGHPTDSTGGKALRPALVLLAAEAVNGSAADAVPAAVAVELVHNFSLLHDDVMDGDTTRRHRPAAWALFGSSAAILAGDALLTLAPTVLALSAHSAAVNGIRLLNTAVQDLIRGQTLDLDFERRSHVTVAEYRAMAEAKTGALLGCACALGGHFGGASTRQIQSLHSFGVHLGLAFQHVDDLLGIWGDPTATGKPVQTDLDGRKKTLPVVAALESGTAAGRELSAMYRQDRPLSPDELGYAADLIDRAGGRSFTETQASQLLAQALDDLHDVHPDHRAEQDLTALARLVTDRDR